MVLSNFSGFSPSLELESISGFYIWGTILDTVVTTEDCVFYPFVGLENGARGPCCHYQVLNVRSSLSQRERTNHNAEKRLETKGKREIVYLSVRSRKLG